MSADPIEQTAEPTRTVFERGSVRVRLTDVPRLLVGRCPLLNTPTLLLVSLVLVAASPSRGEVGAIVFEPVGALGFFTRVGHAGTYFSNICPDGSPVKMRLCRPGEHGGVVSKYSPLSEYEDYDWAIVPFDEFMHGFGASELAPLIGTHGLQRAIEQHNFGTFRLRRHETEESER